MRDSLLRRKARNAITNAFMEIEAYRDKTIEAMQVIQNSNSRDLTDRMVGEILSSYGEHKAEVRRLLTINGKVIPIDDIRRWAA